MTKTMGALKKIDILIVASLYVGTFTVLWLAAGYQFMIPFAVCNILFVPAAYLGLRIMKFEVERLTHIFGTAVIALILCLIAALIRKNIVSPNECFEATSAVTALAAIGYSVFLSHFLVYFAGAFERRKKATGRKKDDMGVVVRRE